MLIILLYMGMLTLGCLIATRLRAYRSKLSVITKPMMSVIYALVLIMGMKMGVDEQVTSNLGTIGIQAFVITFFCVDGSMLAVFLIRKVIGMDRYGNMLRGNHTDKNTDINNKKEPMLSEESRNTGSDISSLKNTVIILSLVVAGMLIGHFVIARYAQSSISSFESFTADLMVVLLCLLLFLVGFDMGLSGSIFSSIKNAGLRVLAFPFAAILGTLIFGAASSMFFGFSLKEGLAISSGFGWYTYAPTVIADAGAQHIVASAVSFMHNVIRETAGIVLIPVVAKHFGYIEATTLPGVAAMDVCMPIVERSCRQDTIVYSFAIGFAMNIGASVLVPFFMSL